MSAPSSGPLESAAGMQAGELGLVVAVAENGVIGRDGDLPWRLPDELKYFKRLTVGHTLIMGRRTFESIGRPLPRRRTLVLTRDPDWQAEGVESFADLPAAVDAATDDAAADDHRIFVVGGSSVYAAALPRTDHLFWTRIHAEVDGDTRFPAVDWDAWRLVGSERHGADERHAFAFTMEHYARKART